MGRRLNGSLWYSAENDGGIDLHQKKVGLSQPLRRAPQCPAQGLVTSLSEARCTGINGIRRMRLIHGDIATGVNDLADRVPHD